MSKWVHRLSNINLQNRTAICSYCGLINLNKRGAGWQCAMSKNMQRNKRRNGVLQPNGTVCELCGGMTKVAFDHCHKTNKFRGWLCMKCNTALGLVSDDVVLLQKMIDYINR